MQLNSLLKALQQEAVAQLPEAQWLPRRQQIDELLDVSRRALRVESHQPSTAMTNDALLAAPPRP
jgi:hypothetical protein